MIMHTIFFCHMKIVVAMVTELVKMFHCCMKIVVAFVPEKLKMLQKMDPPLLKDNSKLFKPA